MTTINEILGIGKQPQFTKPKELYNYLIAVQVRKFGASVDLSYAILARNLKLLVKKYGITEVTYGIGAAAVVAQHPFSTAFVEDMIQQHLHDIDSPALRQYRVLSYDDDQ
jgi:hypothetical protein